MTFFIAGFKFEINHFWIHLKSAFEDETMYGFAAAVSTSLLVSIGACVAFMSPWRRARCSTGRP